MTPFLKCLELRATGTGVVLTAELRKTPVTRREGGRGQKTNPPPSSSNDYCSELGLALLHLEENKTKTNRKKEKEKERKKLE